MPSCRICNFSIDKFADLRWPFFFASLLFITIFCDTLSRDSGSYTMELCSKSFDDAIILYIGKSTEEVESRDSCARILPLSNSDVVRLYLSRFCKVEAGPIVEARPQGE